MSVWPVPNMDRFSGSDEEFLVGNEDDVHEPDMEEKVSMFLENLVAAAPGINELVDGEHEARVLSSAGNIMYVAVDGVEYRIKVDYNGTCPLPVMSDEEGAKRQAEYDEQNPEPVYFGE